MKREERERYLSKLNYFVKYFSNEHFVKPLMKLKKSGIKNIEIKYDFFERQLQPDFIKMFENSLIYLEVADVLKQELIRINRDKYLHLGVEGCKGCQTTLWFTLSDDWTFGNIFPYWLEVEEDIISSMKRLLLTSLIYRVKKSLTEDGFIIAVLDLEHSMYSKLDALIVPKERNIQEWFVYLGSSFERQQQRLTEITLGEYEEYQYFKEGKPR